MQDTYQSLLLDNHFKKQIDILLGKSTRRGVKKCYKCGTYNGTKSSACKNQMCLTVFKEPSEKSKISIDAVQLITGNLRKLYSVRIRTEGLDYRGFVQLPLYHGTNEKQVTEKAVCFVESCQSLFNDNFLSTYEDNTPRENKCVHIDASIKSKTKATPFVLKAGMIERIKVSSQVKQNLFSFLNNKDDVPLVQKVSKNVLVIKCRLTPKHPLGFLHFVIRPPRRSGCDYFCDCFDVIRPNSYELSSLHTKCIHYYISILALISDGAAKEYMYFVGSEIESNDLPDNRLLMTIVNKNINLINNVVEIQNNQKSKYGKSKSDFRISKVPKIIPARTKTKPTITKLRTIKPKYSKIIPIEIRVLDEEIPSNETTNLNFANQKVLENNTISWSYDEWLAYVVESINKSMTFDNYGFLNSLLFYIPEDFFKLLKSHVNNEDIVKESNTILDYEALHILSISQLKNVFYNNKVKLKVSKRYVLAEDGTCMEIDENIDSIPQTNYYIYFLNVGQLTVDESDNVNNSFLIEWFPNTEDVTAIGKLKLTYKYGRKSLYLI